MAVWELDDLRLKNHCRALLQTTIPVYVVELSMGRGFQLEGAALRVSSPTRAWRKENLLNLLEPHVPSHFDHLVWLDSGVALWQPDLEARVEKALALATFIQPFSTCDWIGPGGGVELVWRPYCHGGPDASQGLAWAMKRSTWKTLGGLWAGDVLDSTELEHAMIKAPTTPGALAWLAPLGPTSLGYCHGRATHYWHKITKRLTYAQRREVLEGKGFDPALHTGLGPEGTVEILHPEVAAFAASYLGQTYA